MLLRACDFLKAEPLVFLPCDCVHVQGERYYRYMVQVRRTPDEVNFSAFGRYSADERMARQDAAFVSLEALVADLSVEARVAELEKENALLKERLVAYEALHGRRDDVSKELTTVELNEIYVPFWLKPTRFLNRIFIPIEDVFMHWYCMVVDFGEKIVYHLDSFSDLKMLYAMMTSLTFGPLRQFIPEDMGRWPIRRGNEIPNCNNSDSSAAWVIQWLHPEGSFNLYEISGVVSTCI
ncbi:hypothetical protein Ahy_A07g032934 [Arachis hypogaea]|uniref:Ubiquitin-like protease family profile domain-containing protein n=1 Tax=Arachis hypogaea TaxID=3818 RepID=A0A445C7Z9_ARAHY|nr:hypothetical protein Ahy_A07g032934 [Arachis hypogaea]